MTPTTTGPTSEPPAEDRLTHTAELIERHTILMPLEAVGDGSAFDVARLHALAWARAQGMELVGEPHAAGRADGQGGCTFEVAVGKGDIALDQRVPGVLDSWKWSARMQHWRRVLTNADGRQGRLIARAIDGKASVTRIHPARSGTGPSPIDTDDDLMALAECLTDEQASAEVDRLYGQHQDD